jgi:hypothetical protein
LKDLWEAYVKEIPLNGKARDEFKKDKITKIHLPPGGTPLWRTFVQLRYYYVFLIPINPAIINAIPKKNTYLPLSMK